MKESEFELVRQARRLFPTIKTRHKGYGSEYVVTRALYFHVQKQIKHQRWDEVGRVFRLLTEFCKVDPGWENPVRVEILEDFDFQTQERKVQRLMGTFLLASYRSQRDFFRNWTRADRAERRAEKREFDQAVFGTKPKAKLPPQIRKPVDKLTSADFRKFKIWEFATDEETKRGQDETWVRPADSAYVRVNAYSQLVATKFATPKRKTLEGFMEVTTVENTVEIQPGSIIKGRLYGTIPRVSREKALRNKDAGSIRERERLLRVLRLPEGDLFPLRYELSALIRGEKRCRRGVIQ